MNQRGSGRAIKQGSTVTEIILKEFSNILFPCERKGGLTKYSILIYNNIK